MDMNYKIAFEDESKNRHVVYALAFESARFIADLMYADSRSKANVIVHGLIDGKEDSKIYETRKN